MKGKLIISAIALVSVLTSCEKPMPDASGAPPFTPLEKPAAGRGFQIHIPVYSIAPNYERETWVRKDLGNKEEVYMDGFDMIARPGTHHTIAYNFTDKSNLPPADIMYDQNSPNNTLNIRAFSDGVQLFQSPSASYNFRLPKGFAIRIAPNESFNMNMHNFNKTSEIRYGELYMNFNTVPKDSVKQILDVEYLAPLEIVLPPNQTTVMKTDFIMDKKTIIPLMLSHYHKRGKDFEVRFKGGPRDGQVCYSSQDYENPLVSTFNNTPIVLEKGEGLTSIVKYVNESNRTINFGITSEDEMNFLIIFKYNP
ncbi:MAG: hypothetical protein RL660_2284 [Bacteroidota bacterium]|jgi:hypothetical protein